MNVGIKDDSANTSWPIGSVINNTYEVRNIFTSGGMGIVYQVFHLGWKINLAMKSPRIVALKDMEVRIANFTRECNVWADLGLHTHIVSCYYVRAINGVPHIFAEYVEGGSLEDWITSGKLYLDVDQASLERILDIAIQTAWGLHYAHEQGVIHQDVKPANILMSKDGTAKVTDFGLAKAREFLPETSIGLTGRKKIMVSSEGLTPAYCSPEQVRRERLDERTDIWSWAVGCLEMFFGEVVWLNGSLVRETLMDYLRNPGHYHIKVSIPHGVGDLLSKCLSYDREDRPSSFRDIASSLQDIYAAVLGRHYQRQYPENIELRAGSLNNKALSMIDLNQPALADEYWMQALRQDPHYAIAIYNYGLEQWRRGEITDHDLLESLTLALEPKFDRTTIQELCNFIHLERGDLSTTSSEYREKTGYVDDGPEISDEFEINVGKTLEQLPGNVPKVHVIDIEFGGERALTVSNDHYAKIWDLRRGKVVQEIFFGHTGKYIEAISASKDWRYLLASEDDLKFEERSHIISRWDLTNPQNSKILFETVFEKDQAFTLSPDGRYALFPLQKNLILVDTASGKRIWERPIEGEIFTLKFLPGSKRFLSGPFSLCIWDTITGKIIKEMPGHKRVITDIAINENGTLALTANIDQTLRLWDLELGRCIRVLHGSRAPVTAVKISPDGKYAMSGGHDHLLRYWDLTSGRCLATFGRGDKEETTSIAFDLSTRVALSGGRRLRQWKIPFFRWKAPFIVSVPLSSIAARSRQKEYTELVKKAKDALNKNDYAGSYQHCLIALSLPGYETDDVILDLIEVAGQHGIRTKLNSPPTLVKDFLHELDVTAISTSRDKNRLFIGCGSGRVYIWDSNDPNRNGSFLVHSEDVVHLSPVWNGDYLLSGAWDSTICLWNSITGEVIWKHQEHYVNRKESIALTPDGKYILFATCEDHIDKLDLMTGKVVSILSSPPYISDCIALSPDGRFAYTSGQDAGDGSNRNLTMWDLKSSSVIKRFRLNSPYETVQFCPEARKLFCLYMSGGMDIWDENLTLIKQIGGTARNFGTTSDGRFLVLCHDNGSVEIIDWQTTRPITSFKAHDASVGVVNISANGHYIITGGMDFRAKIWRLNWQYQFGSSDYGS